MLDDIELPKRILALLDEKPVRLQWRLENFGKCSRTCRWVR